MKNIYEDDDDFLPSEQEVKNSLTKVRLRATVMIKAKMKMHLNRTRDNIERRGSVLSDVSRKNSQVGGIPNLASVLQKFDSEGAKNGSRSDNQQESSQSQAKKNGPSNIVKAQRINLLQAIND